MARANTQTSRDDQQEERKELLGVADEQRTLPIRGVFWNDVKVVEAVVERNFAAGNLSQSEYLLAVIGLHCWDLLNSMDFASRGKGKGRR